MLLFREERKILLGKKKTHSADSGCTQFNLSLNGHCCFFTYTLKHTLVRYTRETIKLHTSLLTTFVQPLHIHAYRWALEASNKHIDSVVGNRGFTNTLMDPSLPVIPDISHLLLLTGSWGLLKRLCPRDSIATPPHTHTPLYLYLCEDFPKHNALP